MSDASKRPDEVPTVEPAPKADGLDESSGLLVALLVLTFAMNTIGRGLTETFAVFLLPVQAGLGATRAEISATYSVYMLAYALAAPFAGQLVDRLGARVTYGAGLLSLGSGYALAGLATEVWHYYIAVGLCGGLGAAALGMVAASSLLSRWFSRRMGSVMAAPYAAVGAGMLIFPPLTQVLLDWVGWRSALYVLGLGTLALLPLTLAMPLGRMTEGSREWRASRDGARRASGLWSLSAAMRTGAFWGLFAAYFWTSVAAYSVLPQSVAFLVEQGFNALVAASAFGLTGSLSVCGILAVGWLADRVGRLPTVTMTFLMSITGTLALVGVAVWPSLVLVYVFVVFFGLVQGARGPIILSLLPALYPGGAIGAIFGALSVALGLGAGLGSLLSGYLRQVTGGYVASFSMAAAASLCGLVTFWIVPSLRHERLGGRGGHAGAAPPARRDEREA